MGQNEYTARNTALTIGVIYAIATLIGFIAGGDVGGVMVNMADNVLHLIIALVAIAVGLSKEWRIPAR